MHEFIKLFKIEKKNEPRIENQFIYLQSPGHTQTEMGAKK